MHFMTRLKKIMMINQLKPIIDFHFRESDGRLFIDWIGDKKFKLTTTSQSIARKQVDEIFEEVYYGL